MDSDTDDTFLQIISAISHIDVSLELFNSLFGDVIKSGIKTRDSIRLKSLTDRQTEMVVNMHGHLNNSKAVLNKIKRSEAALEPRSEDDLRKVCYDEIFRLRRQLTKETKKSALLKDLLVNELNRSEAIDFHLNEKVDEIRGLHKSLAAAKRKHESLEFELQEASQSSDASRRKRQRKENPEPLPSFIGKYIYKHFPEYGYFYGLIYSYRYPYYEVAYEDGDHEEIERHRVVAYYVSEDAVPHDKKRLCVQSKQQLVGAVGSESVSGEKT
jgi:hypothetical protein